MALKVSRILHAGFIFEGDSVRIGFDPIVEVPFSRNCTAFPAVDFDLAQFCSVKFDAIFISHYHDDHCSLESLDHLDRSTPLYLFCVHDELFDWIRVLGFSDVHRLTLGEIVNVGTFRVTVHPALDRDVDSVFEIEFQGLRVLNVVDSWIDLETHVRLKSKAPWDLVLWPFQTMRELEVLAPTRSKPELAEIPPEWISQLRDLAPRVLVPSSCQFQFEDWSWYNDVFFPISYARFDREIRESLMPIEVLRLDPGESIELNPNGVKRLSNLSWVRVVESAPVDYQFEIGREVPPTSSIAKNFAALSARQLGRVFEFCRIELAAKFQGLDQSEEPYFARPRLWRLSLFDHEGIQSDFDFLIDGARLVPQSVPGVELAWSTEIPIARLWGALEEGEQLTSLYLRINSLTFADDIEREIASVDILEDPLVRCLFTNAFGSYQKAQLRRLSNAAAGPGDSLVR